MPHDERPIAWLALREGTLVYTEDGDELGRVSTVVADRQKDIFSGIAIRSGVLSAERFVPAARIDSISEDAVRLSLSTREAEDLQTYETR